MDTNIVSLEFNGSLVSFNNKGWINATRIAKKFGKGPYDVHCFTGNLEELQCI